MAKRKLQFLRPQGKSITSDPESLSSVQTPPAPPEPKGQALVKTSVELVLAMAHAHLDYEKNTTALPVGAAKRAKPKFDDLAGYDVSEEEEEKLWELEATRLLQVVENPEEPLQFSHDNVCAGTESKDIYQAIAALSNQLLVNLHTCRHDNELVMMQFGAKDHDASAELSSRSILEKRLDEPERPPGLADKANRSKQFVLSYFALLDYITAVLARWVTLAADSESWQTGTLCGLSKYSAKMKILVRDWEGYALRSLSRAKRITTEKSVLKAFGLTDGDAEQEAAPTRPALQQGRTGWAGADLPLWSQTSSNSKREKELEAFLEADEPVTSMFFSEMAFINYWTSSALLSILQALKPGSRSGHAPDAFDISSLVYRAGTLDSAMPTFIHQDRGGEILGSSRPDFLKNAYPGFRLVQQAVTGLKSNPASNVDPNRKTFDADPRRTGTIVLVQLEEGATAGDTEAQEIHLATPSQVITVMVPLLCTIPGIINDLGYSLSRLSELYHIDMEESLSSRAPEYTAIASIRTKKFETQSNSFAPGADFRSLSRSMVATSDRYAARSKPSANTNAWHSTSAEQKELVLLKARQRREKLVQEGRMWDIEESSVSIKCAKYVYTVLVSCGAIVIGGLMVGIFMGERESGALQGVDPFNIASFSWVLAGFIILLAKSIRVNEWPWRDFLLGRVTCRSLSELRAVTGSDEQDLIHYLLTKEAENVLIAKGPYNQMFVRKGDGGFSIDVKPEIRTLMACGVIFVKVASLRGTALVCLDFRRGSERRDIRTGILHDDKVSWDDMICRYPPKSDDEDVELGRSRGDILLRWKKVLGIYHSPNKRVR